MQGIFITGTNTDVGKTYIGTHIAKQLIQKNITVIPRKPIETGCEKVNGKLVPRDALALHNAADYDGDLAEVCPYRFEPPISPVRAAHLVEAALTTKQLAGICRSGSEQGFVMVEGAGGFYSPLAEDGLNADLAVALQLPLLLVADDKLGVLNQVLLSVEAIRLRGLQLLAVVLNTTQERQQDDTDNAADLREHLDCSIFSIAYSQDGSSILPDALISSLLTLPQVVYVNAAG